MEFTKTCGFEVPEDFYDAALHGATIATISYCLGLQLTDMKVVISAVTTDGLPTVKPRLEFALLDQIKAVALALLVTGSLSAGQLQKLMRDLYPGCAPGVFRD